MRRVIYIVLLLIVLVGIFIWPLFIKVKVTCRSQYGDCENEILAKVSVYSGKSLSGAQRGVTKDLKNDYLVSDFSLQFKLPATLLVNILVKKPQFVLSGHDSLALVDADGTVLAWVQNSTLPRVYVDESVPKPGQKVDDSTLTALKIMGGVFEMYQIESGVIDNGSLVVDITPHLKVIFPVDGDPQVMLGALRLIYPKVTAGELAGKYSVVDLRFKNPVLR